MVWVILEKSFARRLQGFNTTILYHNRSRHEDAESELTQVMYPLIHY